jgi:Calcineurin-like phosphoesterase
LITSPGDTVLNHNNIVTTHKTVWWGWWNKSGETIPDDVFRNFNKVAEEKWLRILLLDSGRNLLFQATCSEIHWDKDHGRVASPDPPNTPTYYSTQKYFSWFQLGEISEIAQAELQTFTYVRVDDFFENKPSKYQSFYGKQVHDADELRQQDRTIWFVRPFQQQDLTHEVRLLNAKQIAPSHFESDFARSESPHLLWVSDLHFSVKNHHAFPLQSTPAIKDLGQAIEDAVRKVGVKDLAGVLVSGDITWKADSAEFDQAKKFFSRLATSSSALDNYRFAVCPGNHDLAFSDEPDNKSAAVNDSVAPEASRAEFSKFYRHLFYLNRGSDTKRAKLYVKKY